MTRSDSVPTSTGRPCRRESRDVSLLPNLIEAMRARGYDDATIRKIAYENWLRVMEQTWGA